MARAMTYVDVNVLTRELLLSIIGSFPSSNRRLRRASLMLALRRHLLWNSKALKTIVAASSAKRDGDFLDKIHSASTALSQQQAQSVKLAVTLEKDMKRLRHGNALGELEDIPNAATSKSAKPMPTNDAVPEGFFQEVIDGMKSMQAAIVQLEKQMAKVIEKVG